MATPVFISSKKDYEISTLDLSKIYEERPQAAICKTCIHHDNRGWKAAGIDLFKAALNGEDVEDLACCKPTQNDIARKAIQTQSYRKVIPLSAEDNSKVVTFLDGCGHQIQPKCNGCERFVRDTVAIPYADEEILWALEVQEGKETKVPYTRSGSPVKVWNATVGGHCSIGEEGIIVAGKTTHCDPVKRQINITPSCNNCAFVDRVGDSWMYDHLSVNANARLDPYEYYTVYKKAMETGENPVAAANLALYLKQIKGSGLLLTLKGKIVNCYSVLKTKETRYLVNYDTINIQDKISTLDEDITILSIDSTVTDIIVQVEDIRLYKRGYRPNLKKYNLVWPPLPSKIGNTAKNDQVDLRINEDCAATKRSDACSITKNKPCYFHAKLPVKNIVTGEIVFHPSIDKSHNIYPPSAFLHIEKVGNKYLALDDDNQLPQTYSDTVANASVFRKWLPSLLTSASRISNQAKQDILEQYSEITSKLHRSSLPQKVRPYWLAPSSIEPSKARCTHPDGMDLRKVFGDTFGLERVDFDFDFGSKNTIEVEEEHRVGFRQHEHTPQQLQEEILTNLMLDPNYDHAIGGKLEADKTLDTTGYSYTYLPLSSDCDSTEEFYRSLDNEIHAGEVSSDDDKITVDRFISKRQQLFGYALNNRAYGKRKPSEMTQLLAKDPDYIIFDNMYDFSAENVKWICLHCKTSFTYEEVNLFDPRCDICDDAPSLIRNHNVREVVNPRATGGVGNAYVKASDSMIGSMQLNANLCDKWVFKEIKSNITYETLYGSESTVIQAKLNLETQALDSEHVKIIKVNSITPEQANINKEYMTLVDEAISNREHYLIANPNTSASELAILFPTPSGTIYQIRAAGSVAKMG